MRRIMFVLMLALVTAAPAAAWTWPASGPIVLGYSFDPAHPYSGGQHRGIDVAGAPGETVAAPASGLVTFAGSLPGNGKSVTILTSDGWSVTLTQLGSIALAKGATVAEGDGVGAIGPSGDAEVSGPYVQLGIRRADQDQGYVDPATLLPVRGTTPDSPEPVVSITDPAAPVVSPSAPPPTLLPVDAPPPVAGPVSSVAAPPGVSPAPGPSTVPGTSSVPGSSTVTSGSAAQSSSATSAPTVAASGTASAAVVSSDTSAPPLASSVPSAVRGSVTPPGPSASSAQAIPKTQSSGPTVTPRGAESPVSSSPVLRGRAHPAGLATARPATTETETVAHSSGPATTVAAAKPADQGAGEAPVTPAGPPPQHIASVAVSTVSTPAAALPVAGRVRRGPGPQRRMIRVPGLTVPIGGVARIGEAGSAKQPTARSVATVDGAAARAARRAATSPGVPGHPGHVVGRARPNVHALPALVRHPPAFGLLKWLLAALPALLLGLLLLGIRRGAGQAPPRMMEPMAAPRTEDPGRARVALRRGPPPPGPRRRIRRPLRRVRALPPAQGQRRADGQRHRRARHAGDGRRRPGRQALR